MQLATGSHIIFLDDDDWVNSKYVVSIFAAIQYHNPDVVTFKGWMTTDGKSRVNFTIKLGEDYVERGGVYYRYPNHLCAIRKSIAMKVPFQNIRHQEDYNFATALKNKGLLKTEVHIDEELYHYRFITNK